MDDASRQTLKSQVEHLLHSNEDAARPPLHAALADEVEGGDFYGPTGPEEMSGETGVAIRNPICDDHKVAERLWRLSEDMTNQTTTIGEAGP